MRPARADGSGHVPGDRSRAFTEKSHYPDAVDLAALGIDAEHERAYRELVSGGPARAGDLAGRLGVTADRAALLLAGLAAAGLAYREAGLHRAAPPEVALRAMLVRRRDELGHAETALAELSALFRASASSTVRDVIELVTGADGVRQRFIQMQSGASSEVRVFVRFPPSLVPSAENEAEPEAVARGVSYRVAVERAILEAPGGWADAESAQAQGEQIRTVNTLPLRMMIVDGDVGMVPLTQAGEPAAVIVHPSGLLDALIALFELVWQRGTPLTPQLDTSQMSELDNRIVSLLLQGFTDRAIAGQLAVSSRTVQRRIRHLMDIAQVGTRVQLGYQLAKRGTVVSDARMAD
jgi:sugar-specific transcriptional regulator TrmB/DNA-binding CsgD family transcriptional regulator